MRVSVWFCSVVSIGLVLSRLHVHDANVCTRGGVDLRRHRKPRAFVGQALLKHFADLGVFHVIRDSVAALGHVGHGSLNPVALTLFRTVRALATTAGYWAGYEEETHAFLSVREVLVEPVGRARRRADHATGHVILRLHEL